jgi:hypothetical protein
MAVDGALDQAQKALGPVTQAPLNHGRGGSKSWPAEKTREVAGQAQRTSDVAQELLYGAHIIFPVGVNQLTPPRRRRWSERNACAYLRSYPSPT